MLYRSSDFCLQVYGSEQGHADARGLYNDKVTLSLMIASLSTEKQNVQFRDFLDLQITADQSDVLHIYVNTYGRPVSYVTMGNCDPSRLNHSSSVWFDRTGASRHGYLIDMCIGEYSVDDTISAWLETTTLLDVSVMRRGRPKAYRTYSTSRLRKIGWRQARVDGRFTLPRGHGMEGHEETSRAAIIDAQEARHILEFYQKHRQCSVELSSFSLIQDLRGIGQVGLATSSSCVVGYFIISLTDAEKWHVPPSNVLRLPLSRFVEGHDIVICDIFFQPGYERQCITEAIRAIADQGGDTLYLPSHVIPAHIFEAAFPRHRCQLAFNGRFIRLDGLSHWNLGEDL